MPVTANDSWTEWSAIPTEVPRAAYERSRSEAGRIPLDYIYDAAESLLSVAGARQRAMADVRTTGLGDDRRYDTLGI